ncbi:EutB [Paenibacillus mucilaginosus 3016]|uniref:Ethanolamine ammonia-lyase large subunit n=1 Tax=Paenibacillus mucilaginosus 3016 TaxID=1116391 RepID=H6NCA5_9BACL|nr:ethanolamine ammonia-lyase subunit EutB [Paenibacillus mucilaginosus]AFC28298.1 EutB [Paenibacillus mucilaginosus 3016]WFA17105.1 ethanolamine ammonia-lyase subunit EutB [Paenibacillus mucilaginosus]
MRLGTVLRGRAYEFADLKEVMAKANEERSGDALAGIAARDLTERIAAKFVLADTTLEYIRGHPLLPPECDEVSRLIEEGVDEDVYREVKSWTVGELREYLLRTDTTGAAMLHTAKGLTSEMIAAVCKLMSNMDLIQAAGRIQVVTTCRTSIGQSGTLASRAQPNHPTDRIGGMKAALFEALSYGVGDAVIGINPVSDSTRTTADLLQAVKETIDRWSIPTQNCVLAHVTTQMRAVEGGAPADMLFQSLAGTEEGNRGFGISAALLEEADALIRERGTAGGPNRWYFETGQGSELSSGAHAGIDQVTLEARCYGLARRFQPFIVNTVVGFIGPEYLYDSKQVIRAGLEDHFMGKLHGLPMGVDICYTNHMKADQNDMEALGVLLGAAGVNFVIGVPMADDCMLNYQSLSYHDIASLREVLGRRPAPAFEAWMERMGLMADGRLTPAAGDGSRFAF